MVKRRDLDKEARDLGYEVIDKKRGNHDAYKKGVRLVPVPKKRDIVDLLADEIRKQLKGKGQR